MSEATPTPWEVLHTNLGSLDNKFNPVIQTDNDGEFHYIARLFSTESTLPGMISRAPCRTEAEANAALIVRAVNSHEQLVEACRESLMVFNALNDGVVSISGAREKCRAALAAAQPAERTV